MLRFARFIFGASSGPFLLNATVKHHTKRYKEDNLEFANTFLRSIFVHDLRARANTDEEAHQMYNKSKLRLAEGGLWQNSADLSNRIEGNEGRLHHAHPTQPTKDATSDKGNPEQSAVT